jgi:hypothetical protein
MINLKQNNLDKSISPYLQQHKDNPIWWQEWSAEIIKNAVHENKAIFVSIGYATCHWCHVMAAEAFSDKETADYLNQNFICIKVDRELRPDIDQFLMNYIIAQSGSGGWPLNVFLTPDIHPFFALTYAPKSDDSMGSFLTIIQKVNDYYKKNSGNIKTFIPDEESPPVAEEYYLIISLIRFADPLYGGFGQTQKFPPHTSLLFLLYSLSIDDKIEVRKVCSNTLDAMCLRGLNDHLQGGIFRYCVDREWTIPHFEKMLYDQAMALWCYSLAFKTLGKSEYKTMAENILRCLDESFEDNGLYISGHDADTEHSEGATYLWDYDKLKNALSPEEFHQLSEVYNIDKAGNFEGKIHLIKKIEISIVSIESKLLSIRKLKAQPDKDEKILCGINALTAIAMIQAARFLEKPELEFKAANLIKRLMELFWNGKTLGHSYYKGETQNQSFLFDTAAVLTAITFLYENDKTWENQMASMITYTETFRQDETWLESRSVDFQPVNASWFDHPIPSSVSLAEMGLTRAALLNGNEIQKKPYREPFRADFYNISTMLSNGLFHIITSKNQIPWGFLKPNSIQVRGETESDCFNGTCSVLKIH